MTGRQVAHSAIRDRKRGSKPAVKNEFLYKAIGNTRAIRSARAGRNMRANQPIFLKNSGELSTFLILEL